jgi:hypothetical protein
LGGEHRRRGASAGQSDALGDRRRGRAGSDTTEGELVLVQLILGPAALIAAGRELDIAVCLLLGATGGVHQAAAPARLGILLIAFRALRVADVMVGFFADGE